MAQELIDYNPFEGMSTDEEKTPSPTSKPVQWTKKVMTKLEAEKGTLILMLKGALPPTISLAIYQSTAVANLFSSLGYLVAIASILGFAIMPRAKSVH